ncbi:hypothetical protein [Streptacidiphilus sp. P02-A3a]|uniref:hypothetical protein n=1 Tax=Streptacidiphilus sp. P02-A3a TaxID=2704468 RepID=UPI0015F8D13B|nr:hypothetical protein [Streptacidiphilus sp. P02-A3a]QMU71827.1 hypothetical protein GXP74_29910 [Streptacidiphilus sp. P02-A3a]
MIAVSPAVQSTKFNLKNEVVELIAGSGVAERALLSVADLEAMRTLRAAVPASKHGLEAITGASCETGAQ